MNRQRGIAVLIALLMLSLQGCDKGTEPTDANQTTAAQLTEKAGQAVQGASEMLVAQKDKLLQASQEQLSKLEERVNEYLSEANTEDEQIKQRLDAMSQSFRSTVVEAQQALKKAQEGGIEVWQHAKPTVEAAVKRTQQAHDQIMAFLKDQAQKETQESLTGPAGTGIIE